MTKTTLSKFKSLSRTTDAKKQSKDEVLIAPQLGPQTDFLSTSADIALYGGAAGGGKSWSLLVEPLRNISTPGFNAVIFRRTSPEITNQGGLWDESLKIYPHLKATPNETDRSWTFKDGPSIQFGHMQYEKDLLKWWGSQICLIEFDELNTFTRKQFLEMLARNRSTCGVVPYIRASCNPDPDSWVLELVDWFIDEAGDPIAERSGVLRWFIIESDSFVWASSAKALEEKYPGCRPLSFTFIPAKVQDNKILMQQDPAYLSKLMALPAARRAALLGGNWRTKAVGKMFKREWFKRCDPEDVPDLVRVVVGVDPSGGHGIRNDEQGIFAIGKARNGKYYVLEDGSCKLSPGGWGKQACQVYHDRLADIMVGEANFGGEMVENTVLTVDRTINFKLVHAARGKAVRAEPTAALYEKGEIIHVGVFTEAEDEMVSFDPSENLPSPNRMDALVWAMTELIGESEPTALSALKALVEMKAQDANKEFDRRKGITRR